jgi:hypothetical protein
MGLQLEPVEAQLNLVVMTRYAELGEHYADRTPRLLPDRGDRQPT